MDKITLIRNFSKYAYLYDRYADIQRFAADKLLEQIKQNNFREILEIGCGTGIYTTILYNKFPEAKIRAIDISDRMIEVAAKKLKDRDIEFVIADAEEIDLDKGFDLITSNACFQWFSHLENTLLKYKGLLNKRGIISFSIFGPLTFCELDKSLKKVLKDVNLQAHKFLPKNKIENILKENFKNFKIEEIRFTKDYSNLKELLDKIRYTGIKGDGLKPRVYFSSQLLKKLEETYLNGFGHVKATYQIFLCEAIVE